MSTIVLITADSLRYDHVSYTGIKEETTPFVDQMARRGVFFENALSTGSGTSTAFPGILASALPMDHGYRGLNASHTPLASVLADHDVETVGVTASTHTTSLYEYDEGFRTFWQPPEIERGENASETVKRTVFDVAREVPGVNRVGRGLLRRIRRYRRRVDGPPKPYPLADEVTDVAIEEFEQGRAASESADLFFWVHYMEPHSPPFPPTEYVEAFHDGSWDVPGVYELWKRWRQNRPRLWDDTESVDAESIHSEEEKRVLREFYAAQVRFLDEEVRRLVTELRDRATDVTVVFTADHGEEFFEHGDLSHRQKLYEELVHVPLVVTGDRIETTRDVSTVVSLADIGPTILDWFGVPQPTEWYGRRLPLSPGTVEELARDHVYAELCHRGVDDGYGGDVDLEKAVLCVRTEEWKYIQNEQRDSCELYYLPEDPTETENLVGQDRDIETTLRERAQDRLSSVTRRRVADVNVSSRVQERLSQLGYTEQ